MSRARLKDSGGGVSLFPCLAVLLCAMGALLLMLFALTQHAKALGRKAAAETALQTPAEPAVSREAIEDHEWQVEMLRQARDKTAAQLNDKRLELSLVEEHARRIGDELRRTEAELAALETRRDDSPAGSPGKTALDAEIAELQTRLEALRAQQANQKGSYAIVPSIALNGTRRRPIYIECRGDTVIFQPEGIELSEKDFRDPLGPGNPLASGLRAASEYLVSQGHRADTLGEPYPLLLVRGDGVAAYGASRAAMKSWGSELGYEFVPDDWRLSFPPADPMLTDTIRRAVDEARRRHEAIIAAAPRLYGGGAGGSGNGFGFGSGAAGSGQGKFRGNGGVAGTARENATGGGADGGSPPPRNSTAGGQPSSAGAESHLGEYREPPPKLTAEQREKVTKSLAESRGKNWGLPESSRGATPVARPVRIECRDTLLTVHAASGGGVKQIAMEGATVNVVEPLVASVWENIDAWGIAGRNMYWKPVLLLEVFPGGERRFADLKHLLTDSGLEVQEKLIAPSSAAAKYPAASR